MPLRCAVVTSTAIPGIRIEEVKLRWFAFLIVLLAVVHQSMTTRTRRGTRKFRCNCDAVDANKPESRCSLGRRSTLITAIIAIESGGNPNAVSK